ncbi:MAG: response regulator [Mariprofundaceae bacterium]
MVYIIDDEPMILEILSEFIKHLGHQTHAFESGEAFLTHMNQNDAKAPHIVFSDIRMPGMTGLEMIQQFKLRHPDIPCCIITGFDDTLTHDHPVYSKLHCIIHKPFQLEKIQEALEILD